MEGEKTFRIILILLTSQKYIGNRHIKQQTWECSTSMNAKALKSHQKNDATLVLELWMASLLCARECLLIFCLLANGRKRPTHSWLLYPLLAHADAGTYTACGHSGSQSYQRRAHHSPGVRLGPPSPTVTVGGLSCAAF